MKTWIVILELTELETHLSGEPIYEKTIDSNSLWIMQIKTADEILCHLSLNGYKQKEKNENY